MPISTIAALVVGLAATSLATLVDLRKRQSVAPSAAAGASAVAVVVPAGGSQVSVVPVASTQPASSAQPVLSEVPVQSVQPALSVQPVSSAQPVISAHPVSSTTPQSSLSPANPDTILPEPSSEPEPTEPDVDWCANYDGTNPESALEVWNDRGVGSFLDEYLSANGESGWLNKMASDASPGSGDTGAAGCGYRDQSCFNGLSCPSLAGSGHGAEYWVFNAATKLQEAMERAHEKLQDSVIDSSLTVSGIASDFAITFSSTPQILRYVAAAFGMAGGVINFVPGGQLANTLKFIAGSFGNAFAASANSLPVSTLDASKSMDSALKDIFHAEIDYLDSILKTAVGGEGDYAALPGQTGDYSTSVAKFFSDGVFLQQGEQVNDFFTTGYDILNKKLVDVALQQYGYLILRDENYDDPDSCNEQHGAFWMELEGGNCIRLAYHETDNVYWPVPNDIIDKLQDKYQYNMFDYYTAACDCAINGSGEPDTDNIPEDGSAPQCFYNIKCQYASVCQESNGDWSLCWPENWVDVRF